MTPELSRRISGMLFLSANILLFVTNLKDTNTMQLVGATLFMTCSVALILSAKNHRWLFWGGLAVAIAYILTALSNNGDGAFLAYLSIISGVFAGALIFRGGLQRETGKQMALIKPFDVLDKYPLAMAGIIEGSCCVLLFISALLDHDPRLMIASVMWVIAHGFLIYSDEYLRARLQNKDKYDQ